MGPFREPLGSIPKPGKVTIAPPSKLECSDSDNMDNMFACFPGGGRSKCGRAETLNPDPGRLSGFDSVIGREGQRGVDEWVFFRSDQLLPCFLLDEPWPRSDASGLDRGGPSFVVLKGKPKGQLHTICWGFPLPKKKRSTDIILEYPPPKVRK